MDAEEGKVPFTMLKRMSVATGAGVVAAAAFALRATKDQRSADRWNRTRLARGVTLAGRRFVLHAPHKVGGRGARGRWHWGADDCHRRKFRSPG